MPSKEWGHGMYIDTGVGIRQQWGLSRGSMSLSVLLLLGGCSKPSTPPHTHQQAVYLICLHFIFVLYLCLLEKLQFTISSALSLRGRLKTMDLSTTTGAGLPALRCD